MEKPDFDWMALAVVIATIVGPIAAVLAARWDDRRRARHDRQWGIFSTLMSLRGRYLDPAHVRALNSVHMEFSDCPKVVNALGAFLAHVETPGGTIEWNQKFRDLMTDLLVEIGKIVGFRGSALEISRNAYYPVGWGTNDTRTDKWEAFKEAVAEGRMALPVFVVPPAAAPTDQNGAPPAN